MVTPSDTRADIASGLIQNDIHCEKLPNYANDIGIFSDKFRFLTDMITIKHVGV